MIFLDLASAMLALIFLARRVQPSLSLVDRWNASFNNIAFYVFEYQQALSLKVCFFCEKKCDQGWANMAVGPVIGCEFLNCASMSSVAPASRYAKI